MTGKAGMIAVASMLLMMSLGGTSAQAATQTRQVTTIPKVLRGTWYHYYGSNTDGLRKTVMTKHHYRSYRDDHQMRNLSHVAVVQTRATGKWRTYTVIDRRDPQNNYQESHFALHRMKVRGKSQWVLVQPQPLKSLKPVVLTRFNPGTQKITLPTTTYRFLLNN